MFLIKIYKYKIAYILLNFKAIGPSGLFISRERESNSEPHQVTLKFLAICKKKHVR